jgi:hypothetical protein
MNAKTKQANCGLLASESTGSESYIRKQTPFDTRREEIMSNPQYQSGAIDKTRERSTAAKRKHNSIRPL